MANWLVARKGATDRDAADVAAKTYEGLRRSAGWEPATPRGDEEMAMVMAMATPEPSVEDEDVPPREVASLPQDEQEAEDDRGSNATAPTEAAEHDFDGGSWQNDQIGDGVQQLPPENTGLEEAGRYLIVYTKKRKVGRLHKVGGCGWASRRTPLDSVYFDEIPDPGEYDVCQRCWCHIANQMTAAASESAGEGSGSSSSSASSRGSDEMDQQEAAR